MAYSRAVRRLFLPILALVVASVLLAIMATPARPAVRRPSVPARTLGPRTLLARLNLVRAWHGRRLLRLSRPLDRAAMSHSIDMETRGFFGHRSGDGTSFATRIRHFYPWRNCRVWMAGENLLWSAAALTPARAVRVWMHSPRHRANLLNPNWREVGIAVRYAADAPGFFGNRTVTLVTADFGVRR
jgi:uncharacterized protein YkwD